MSSARPRTPSYETYGNIPPPNDPSHVNQGYGVQADASVDLSQTPGHPTQLSPLSQSLQQQSRLGKFDEDFDASRPNSSVFGDGLERSPSVASNTKYNAGTPSRSNTLKKKNSVSRKSSLRRSGSRKSLRAGSIRGVSMGNESTDYNSAFYTPIPTGGHPTDVLVNRFQAWRKMLKDLVNYFREVQTSYETRSKALLKVSNVVNNTNAPSMFLTEGGLNDANRILRDYHKQAVLESNKAKEIESEVIVQLNGLRGDLSQKIKEIKSLSGDFKNSVDKEQDGTRKAVAHLEDALQAVDLEPDAVIGKGDPYVVRLAVDRQVERQVDEENYLHRAYLNLEGSGRELESIVVGEIQKAYNALAGILKRDADEAYSTLERLKSGPLAMPRDYEWSAFVEQDPNIVNPRLPLRKVDDIEYPGKHHPAAAEVRAGMLERKSKYLKSYTPGWYVLSPTHLHEFKSADRLYSQPPVMSLYLPDQKLGSHSQPNSSSHKFILKGRQTGTMHRGHSWVFRAESFDTMIAWFEDIRILTEKTGEERNAYVRKHARSLSGSSNRAPSIASSADLEEDEADEVPYAANHTINQVPAESPANRERPQPGGRFPSDIQVNRHLQAPLAPSSGSSEDAHDVAGAHRGTTQQTNLEGIDYADQQPTTAYATDPHQQETYDVAAAGAYSYNNQPDARQEAATAPANSDQHEYRPYGLQYSATDDRFVASPTAQKKDPIQQEPPNDAPQTTTYNMTEIISPTPRRRREFSNPERHNSAYGEWMAPAAAAGGAVVGAEAYRQYQSDEPQQTTVLHETPPPNNMPAAEDPGTQEDQTTVAVAAPVIVPVTSKDDSAPVSATTSLGPETPAGEGTSFGDIKNDSGLSPKPGVSRTNTDNSVSNLHVPGEYPKERK